MQQYKKNLGKVSLTSEGVWNVKNSYEVLSIVYDEHTEHGFISKKDVPAGVDLYNKEYWMPFNVSGYADNNIIILSNKISDGNIQSYTLEEAIASIKSVGRRPGAILGFYNENADRLDIGGRWELWQFNDTNIYNWDNVDSWQNLYYNYNKFMGWFKDENFLNKYAPFPEIGCYAFVGSEFNEATVYRCDNKYVWNNTTQHAWDYVKIIVDGNVTVGENGNWFNNGEDTGIPASVKGENGKTPIFREKDNTIQYSFDNINWITISNKVTAWFRWNATTGDTQANNVGRIQISRDNVTWTNLSGDIINNLHISRYIGADESLPTSGIAEGTIYAKGPYYDEGDTLNDNPIYRLWVYAWKGNALAWQDNGEFTSIVAGVVQETGDSETEVMSQKAVTDKFSELRLEINKGTYIDGIYSRFIKEIYLFGTEDIDLSKIKPFFGRIPGGSNPNYQLYFTYGDSKYEEMFGFNYAPSQKYQGVIEVNAKVGSVFANIKGFAVLNYDYIKNLGIYELGADDNVLNSTSYDVEYSPLIKDFIEKNENISLFEDLSLNEDTTVLYNYIKNIEIKYTQPIYAPEDGNKYTFHVYYMRHIDKYVQVGIIAKNKDGKGFSTSVTLVESTLQTKNTITKQGWEISVEIDEKAYELPIVPTSSVEFIDNYNVIKTIILNSNVTHSYGYFSNFLLRNNQSRIKTNLAPMLDVGISVPNGGIYHGFGKHSGYDIIDIFDESPYVGSNIMYLRPIWYYLESSKGTYNFNTIENLMKSAIENKQRVIVGIGCNCYSSKNEGWYAIDSEGNERGCSIPQYLFEELQASDYPMYEDDTYAKWYSPNYDSPLLLERFEALLAAFYEWLQGYVDGTSIKRYDVLFGIEQRYLGYWGEGGVKNYPITNLFDGYIDAYFTTFPDKYIFGGMQELGIAPTMNTIASKVVAAKHCYHLLSASNIKGVTGLYKDSWNINDDKTSIISNKVLMDDDGNIIPLAKYLFEHIYGKSFIGGEFGYLETLGGAKDGYVPYQACYEEFKSMRMSGLRVHNYTISHIDGSKVSPISLYQNAKDVLSMIGYRLVLHTPTITSNRVSFYINNIGTSKVFADYYKIHIIVNRDGTDIEDTELDFDLRQIAPIETLPPLAFNPAVGTKINGILSSSLIDGDKIYIRVDDEKGIEYPLTFSNYGRIKESEGGDGRYLLLTV